MRRPPPRPTLFPYTTLFRSLRSQGGPCLRRVGAPLHLLRRTRCAAPSSSDRKSTRLNSSHVAISYAVFCSKKKISEITFCGPSSDRGESKAWVLHLSPHATH